MERFCKFPVRGGPGGGKLKPTVHPEIYGWDVIVNGGYPPSTYTGVGTFPFPMGGAVSSGVPYSYGTIC